MIVVSYAQQQSKQACKDKNFWGGLLSCTASDCAVGTILNSWLTNKELPAKEGHSISIFNAMIRIKLILPIVIDLYKHSINHDFAWNELLSHLHLEDTIGKVAKQTKQAIGLQN